MGTHFGYSIIYFALYVFGALFIFLKNVKDVKHIFLAFVALCLGAWQISLSLFFQSTVYRNALLWGKSTFLFAFLISFSFYLFSIVFPHKNNIWHNIRLRILSCLPALIVGLMIVLTDLIVTNINPQAVTLGRKAAPGTLFFVAGISFIMYITAGLYFLNRRLKNAIGREKKQILFLDLSIGIWGFFFSIFTVILPIFGNTQFTWLAPMVSFLFIIGVAYALLKYRLLDIQFVIKRTTLYVVLVSFITGIYAFILIIPSTFLSQTSNWTSLSIITIAAIIITTTILPLRNWLDHVTDRIFFQKKYDYPKIIEKVSKQLSTALRTTDAYDTVIDPMLNEIHVKGVAIYLHAKPGDESFECQKKAGSWAEALPDKVNDSLPLIEYLGQHGKYLEPAEFRYEYGHLYTGGEIKDPVKAAIQEDMDHVFHGGLLIPLMLKTTMIGFMVLGEKRSGDQYSHRDLSLLGTIATQLVTALDNIRLYEQIFNNERLAVIGTMSASIAHEIRNPLASIKTFIQMLENKHDSPPFMEKFNRIVPSEVERIAKITADLLAFSKPSAPTLTAVNVAGQVDKVVALLAPQLRKKQIKTENLADKEMTIHADSQQFTQVILNMFLNAMQASPNGTTITVTTKVREEKRKSEEGQKYYGYIMIQDHGIGIKEKELANIFQPFFTTKTDGTGLGLPTCKRIVEAHQGFIDVESKENVGTKMTVVVPMNLSQADLGLPAEPAPVSNESGEPSANPALPPQPQAE